LNQILIDDVVFIDEKYNLFRHYHYFGNDAARADIRILHFVIKKPWDIFYKETVDAQLVYLDDLWTSFLSDHERSELIAHWRKNIFLVSEQQRIQHFEQEQIEPLQKRLNRLETQSKRIVFATSLATAICLACFVLLFYLLRA
jgi:lipopolysaccharide biosynthesis glycosyltransferase